MSLPRPFLASQMQADCDQCGGRVDLVRGGICTRCERILCATHLHGSFVQRLIADVRGTSLCIDCRRSGAVVSAANE